MGIPLPVLIWQVEDEPEEEEEEAEEDTEENEEDTEDSEDTETTRDEDEESDEVRAAAYNYRCLALYFPVFLIYVQAGAMNNRNLIKDDV